MEGRKPKERLRSYSLIILFYANSTLPHSIVVDTRCKEIYSYKFLDIPMYLELFDICNREFEKRSFGQEWFLFLVPRKFQKGLKFLFLCLRELRISSDKENLPSISSLINLFKKHRWKRLEKIYKLHKLSQVLKTKEGV